MNLQASKIKASRTKTAWKSAENSKKTAEKSVNLRANFDKNKKVSRIKALREFTMKRLTDFFGEKGWKTGKMGYNENRKRSKYCCWTVPMSDWNRIGLLASAGRITLLNRTYEWLKLELDSGLHLKFWKVEPYLWVIETRLGSQWTPAFFSGWTVPMSDMLLLLNSLFYTNTMNCFVNLQRRYE